MPLANYIVFKYLKPIRMDEMSIYRQLVASLADFHHIHGSLPDEVVKAEVINNACLDILLLRRRGRHDKAQESFIINTYIEVAREIAPAFDERYAVIANVGIRQHVEWEGMWDFLRNYFKDNHGKCIDSL